MKKGSVERVMQEKRQKRPRMRVGNLIGLNDDNQEERDDNGGDDAEEDEDNEDDEEHGEGRAASGVQ